MTILPSEVEALKSPFDLSEYEVREGVTARSGKVRWFIYVRREAIINRFDAVFPGEWENNISDMHITDGFATANCTITVRGITRQLNGSCAGNNTETNIKGAATDAFKRAASMWGVGLNLQSAPTIWTSGGFKTEGRTEWKMRESQEKEALAKFGRWLDRGTSQKRPDNVTPLQQPQQPSQQPSRVWLVSGNRSQSVQVSLYRRTGLSPHTSHRYG